MDEEVANSPYKHQLSMQADALNGAGAVTYRTDTITCTDNYLP
jgi:hypothetical protein